jgi:hypoxia up-regulated 1
MVPVNDSNTTNATTSSAELNTTANSSNVVNSTNSTIKKPKMVRQTVEKSRKRMHHVPLTRSSKYLGDLIPISKDAVQQAIEKNNELLRQDKIRNENAMSKNALESYIIETRGNLMSMDDIEKVSPEEVRSELCGALEATEDWLYEEGMELPAAEYKKKLKEVSEAPSKIFFRLEEMSARPKAVEQAKSALNWTTTLVASWAEERPEITEAERNRTLELCENFTAWLMPLLEKQEATPLTDEPAFTSRDVSLKLSPIEKEVRKLIKKPKPKPPKVKRNNTNLTNSTNSSLNSPESANTTIEEDVHNVVQDEETHQKEGVDEKKDEL